MRRLFPDKDQAIHNRVICPVGKGGFAVEKIGNYVVVYDCGSSSSYIMTTLCIDHLRMETDHVDVLFISHFDLDHVNSLRYLIKSVKVNRALTTMIPGDMRVVYDTYTNGAYSLIMNLLKVNGIYLDELEERDNYVKRYPDNKIWEWVAKSMMTKADFSDLKVKLKEKNIEDYLLQDPAYLEEKKNKVNAAFIETFGEGGPNGKGLIVLSQPCKGVEIGGSDVIHGCCFYGLYCELSRMSDVSSCLYVGDANLKNKNNISEVKAFLNNEMTEKGLLLMQIPHHGSKYSSGEDFDVDFPAELYFVNDVDTRRLQGNAGLYKKLNDNGKLIVVKDKCKDMLGTRTEVGI